MVPFWISISYEGEISLSQKKLVLDTFNDFKAKRYLAFILLLIIVILFIFLVWIRCPTVPVIIE